MRVLVTGANGFLSGHIVHELLGRGYDIRAMMRPGAQAPALSGLDIELIRGNITVPADVEKAVRGCDIVIHAAADTKQSHRRTEDYFPVNVGATKHIIDAVAAENCRRLIFVSSANTMGFGSLENPGNESSTASPLFLRSGYAKSKILAQDLVLESVKKNRIDAVVVNPTFIIGPVDHNPHSGRIFKMVLDRKFVFYPPGGKNFVDVRDAARAIVNAIGLGKSGECYLISGENISFRDFFRKVGYVSGQKTRYLSVPKYLLILSGIAGSIFHLLGIPSELSLANARILCINNFYDNSKAVSQLDLPRSGIENTIADYLSWLKKERPG